MKKKPKINKDIHNAGKALAEVMKEQLQPIAQDLIKQVIAKAKRLPPSQSLKALSGLSPRGTQSYTSMVKTALAVMANDAFNQVRKEIPSKKNVRLCEHLDSVTLGEFEKLPPALQQKITTMTNLLVGKQMSDLQKVIEFAYQTADEETDSIDQIQSDLSDSAIGWVDGTAIESGAMLNAASVINSARQAFFMDDEVSDSLDALQFTNGDPVTPICQDLAGTIFSQDDPSASRYFPPLHWNCKSYIVPILSGNLNGREIESLAPSKKSLEDDVQFHEHFDGSCCGDHSD